MPPKTRQANQAKKGPVCGTESRMVAKEIVMFGKTTALSLRAATSYVQKATKIFQSFGNHLVDAGTRVRSPKR